MRVLTLLLAAALSCGMVHAQVPNKVNYQGFLTDPAGQPINATLPMVFKLYKVSSGGLALHSEPQTVAVNQGLFDVVIGAVTPLNLPFDVQYYLGVAVGADPEMTPRQLVTASPYALRAATADALDPNAGVDGQQISGLIASATLPTGNLSGNIATAQIANNAVTQAKLSPISGAASGKVLGTDGSNLQWQAQSAGTVTSVGTGTGLSGGPITGSGTINLAATQLLPAVACAPTQIAKWNGSTWACAADNDTNSGGTVTSLTQGAGITLTPSPITGSGTIAVDPSSSTLTGNFFKQGGNAFGAKATLGTSDNNAVEINVNNQRILRFDTNPFTANIALGNPSNVAGGGDAAGATVSGGGGNASNCLEPSTGMFNRPCANRALWSYGTIGGGYSNLTDLTSSTVSGGERNTANGSYSTVVGGIGNTASGGFSTVGGGQNNTALGEHSFAAGRQAIAAHPGAFVWADNQAVDYISNGFDTFNIRATGGLYLSPGTDLKSTLSFGSQTRQMLNLYGVTWGIGVQSSTQYFRSGNHFAWFLNGTHSDTSLDPGSGGGVLMTLTNGTPGGLPAVTGTARAQVFTSTSDRNAKEAFAAVDGERVLAALVRMPLQSWKYRNEDAAVRHIGPTAQDFRAAFGIGYDDKTIATVDADGVALAAIQGLHAKLQERDAQLARQQAELDALKQSLAELQLAMRAMTITVAAR